MCNTYAEMLGVGNKIFEARDSLGPVKVFDNDYERYLTFGSIYEQSCQKKSDPGFLMHEHTRAMILPLVFHTPKRAMVLGLGGGSLVNCLYHRFPDITLEAVERRQIVIDIARQYFLVPSDPRLTIRCEDAGVFMEEVGKGSVDLLFCDLFNANGLDEVQRHPGFLSDCHAMLSENGWVAFNYFNGHAETLDAIKSLEEQFEAVFTCYLFTGNLIVLAGKQSPDKDHAGLVARAKRLERHLGFPLVNHFLRLNSVSQENRAWLNSPGPVF